jgi:hypothetical protein
MAGWPRSGCWRTAILLVTAVIGACTLSPAVESPEPATAIDEDLRAYADRWEVLERDVGAGKIHDFQFGEYATVSGEIGARTVKTTRTHLALEKHRRAVTSYSFVLHGVGASTASAQATQNSEVTWHTLLEFLPGLYIGLAGGGIEYSSDSDEDEDEDCWESDDDCWEDDEGHKRVKSAIDEELMATLVVDAGAPTSWQLALNSNRSGVLAELVVRSASLTDGHRIIAITPSTSFERNDGAPTWAYRFVEDGTTLAALEFADRTKSVVWMRRELPEDTRLMLATAITAILQGQSSAPKE